MSEPTETPAPTPQPDATTLNQLTQAIAKRLNEPNVALLAAIIAALGLEQAQALLTQTLEIEAGAGLMLKDGSRRRTPGGVFMYLARRALPTRLKRKIWPPPRQAKAPERAQPQSTSATLMPLTWEEAKPLISQALQAIGEARTVKITLVGRPDKVIQQSSCVVVALKGKEPPSLPKGLPTPLANSAMTWAIFIANKQWDKVKAALTQNAED